MDRQGFLWTWILLLWAEAGCPSRADQSPVLFLLQRPSPFCPVLCSCQTRPPNWEGEYSLWWFCRISAAKNGIQHVWASRKRNAFARHSLPYVKVDVRSAMMRVTRIWYSLPVLPSMSLLAERHSVRCRISFLSCVLSLFADDTTYCRCVICKCLMVFESGRQWGHVEVKRVGVCTHNTGHNYVKGRTEIDN